MAGQIGTTQLTPHTVLIAPSGSLMQAEQLLGDRDLLSFADEDIQQAVQTISDLRPSVVVLERSFAASPRGGALVNRVRFDADLSDVKIQLVTVDEDSAPVRALPTHTIIPSSSQAWDPPTPPDYRGTRQQPRVAFELGVLVKVDGDPATVVDMSRIGAQVLVAEPLRPGQAVRVWADRRRPTFRCVASVVWVQYELHVGPGGYYRAGLCFRDADSRDIEAFCLERGVTAAVA